MLTAASAAPLRTVRIDARFDRVGTRLRELWAHREVVYFLVWRDVKVRYKQTALGVAWVILQPLLMMLVFTALFGRLARVPSDGLPYPVFAYLGLLPWQLFATGLGPAANSLVANERLVTKVYFPRLAIPVAAVITGLVDVAVGLAVLAPAMLHYGFAPTRAVLALPALVLLATAAATAAGVGLAALNVQFRDVRHALPFLAQLWMFATPVAYPSSLLPARWRLVYALNPMVGVTEGFRWALLGRTPAPLELLIVSVAATAVGLWAALAWFARVERGFADTV
jgi:lipopolysaccharide transport system permease protein